MYYRPKSTIGPHMFWAHMNCGPICRAALHVLCTHMYTGPYILWARMFSSPKCTVGQHHPCAYKLASGTVKSFGPLAVSDANGSHNSEASTYGV